MKKIKIGQIGIGHNHGSAKMMAVRKFPANLVAMIFGFDQKAYFEADATASAAPKVEF